MSKRTYWYLYESWECQLCGRVKEYKERVYDRPKPKEWYERHIRHDDACYDHFW